MKNYLALVAVAALASACGDNSRACGEGTTEVDGYCVSDGMGGCGPGTVAGTDGTCGPICTGGTIPGDSGCVIDPDACQGGTVLVGGECVDPAEVGVVDLEEGQEPNGLGVGGEASTDPAGIAALRAIGAGAYVIHGTIVPADHDGDGFADGDIDTYTFTTTGPVLLQTSADGLHGLSAAFAVLASVEDTDPLADFRRFALTTQGDASRRQLFLPRAGTYTLSVADTRSFLVPGTAVGGAPAGPALEYYVSLEAIALPAPEAITLDGTGAGSATGTYDGTTRFFTAQLGTGFNRVDLRTDSSFSSSSLVNFTSQTFRRYDEGPIASLQFAAAPGDTSIVVVEPAFTFEYTPVPFELSIASRAAFALPANGVIAGPESGTAIVDLGDVSTATAFYLDVATAGDIVDLALVWNQAVRVILVDQDLAVVSLFTWQLSGGGVPVPGTRTMTAYRGQLRFAAPGRYFFLAVEPAGTGAAMIQATSQVATATVAPIVTGTPLVNQPVPDAFGATTFSYAAMTATTPWQDFDVTGTATGPNTVAFLDPATAFGRLDPLTTSATTIAAEPAPVFGATFPAAGDPLGRILLDDPTEDYLVHVRPTSAAMNRTVTLDFAAKAFVDHGTLAASETNTQAAQTLPAISLAPNYYLVRTPPGSPVTITIDQTSALTNVTLAILDRDEAVTRTIDAGGAGVDETALEPSVGWIAYAVTGSLANATATSYSATVDVAAPVTYAITSVATAFDDACVGGATVPLSDQDEDVSSAITLPTGFAYFGVAATSLVASTNGWASVRSQTDPQFANLELPLRDGVDGVIAPYWDDLDDVVICTKLVGTRRIVQWTGVLFEDPTVRVRTQAIFDGADDSIELVWDPNAATGHEALGDLATIGIEDTTGTLAQLFGFDTPGAIVLGMNRKLTPN